MSLLKKFENIDGHFSKYLYKDFTFTQESLNLGLIAKQAGYLDAGPKYILNPRTLYHYSIIYVSKGVGHFRCLGKTYDLQPNTAYFLFPSILHSYSTDIKNLFSHWWVDFYGYNARVLISSIGVTPESPVIYNIDLLKEFEDLLSQSSDNDSSESLMASCQLYRLFGILSGKVTIGCESSSSVTTMSTPFLKAKRYLEANYREEISIDEASRLAGVSSTHLIKLFTANLGCSPSQYLATLRVDSSKKLLLETNMSIVEIAHISGFNDPHYFSRFFKKHTGFSPQKLRDMTIK